MPTRAYKASTAYASAHIKANLWLWIAIATAAMAVATMLRQGTVAAFLGMVLGIFVMMKSQEGYVPPEVAADEDDLPMAVAPAAPQP